MIERVFDARRLNEILNHPAVRPDVADMQDGVIDVSKNVENVNNILLMGEFGATFFFKTMPGVYEVHTQCLPEGRGKWVVDFVRASGDWMYTRTDAFEITTRIPAEHFGARRLARFAGMMLEFSRPNECKWRGKLQGADIYSYRIQDWAKLSEGFEQPGRDFHTFLHAEADRLGVSEKPHGDDPNHNRYVGICLAMVKGGQVGKAVSFYNRWAVASRHPTIALISEAPVTVRFDIGNLIFEPDGDIRVETVDMAA